MVTKKRVAMVAWAYGGKKGTYAEDAFSPEMKCLKVCEGQGGKDAEECLRLQKWLLGLQKLTYCLIELVQLCNN